MSGIQYIAVLQQSINFTNIGTYILSFYYSCKPEYLIDHMQIYSNGFLIDTLTVPQNNLVHQTNSKTVNTTGNYIFSFNGQDSIHDNDAALVLIPLTLNYQAPVYYAPPLPSVGTIKVTVPKTLNSNQWKSANIYGFLNLYDYKITGATISGQFGCTKDILVNNT